MMHVLILGGSTETPGSSFGQPKLQSTAIKKTRVTRQSAGQSMVASPPASGAEDNSDKDFDR